MYQLEQSLEFAAELKTSHSQAARKTWLTSSSLQFYRTAEGRDDRAARHGDHLCIKVRDLDLKSTDIVAQSASQFSTSRSAVLSAAAGWSARAIYNDESPAIRELVARVGSGCITIAETVPALLRAMSPRCRYRHYPRCAGCLRPAKHCRPNLPRMTRSAGERIRLLNAYGPTECSDDVTHYEVTDAPAQQVVRMPIGRALSNTQLYIVVHSRDAARARRSTR